MGTSVGVAVGLGVGVAVGSGVGVAVGVGIMVGVAVGLGVGVAVGSAAQATSNANNPTNKSITFMMCSFYGDYREIVNDSRVNSTNSFIFMYCRIS